MIERIKCDSEQCRLWKWRLDKFFGEADQGAHELEQTVNRQRVIEGWIKFALGRQHNPAEYAKHLFEQYWGDEDATTLATGTTSAEDGSEAIVRTWCEWCERQPWYLKPNGWIICGCVDNKLPGRYLKYEAVCVPWGINGDWSGVDKCPSFSEFVSFVENRFPNQYKFAPYSVRRQIWQFMKVIEPGDGVLVPIHGKRQDEYAVGVVAGPFQYDSTKPGHHRMRRPVKWRTVAVGRQIIDEGLLIDATESLTIIPIRRDDAGPRIHRIVKDGPDPGPTGPQDATDAD